MLPTFVIGLREGLEAALIVGIIAAFLKKQGRVDLLRWVFVGVGVAVLLCLGVGIALDVLSRDLPQKQQEGLETVVGALAVGMVTYMVVWMKRHSRELKGTLESAAAEALEGGASKAGRAMVVMAFLAVLREGFETVVFLLAAFNETGSGTPAAAGAILGIAVAVVLGWGIYRGGVRLNLSKFFRATGLVLVLVAAGLVLTAFHTAHEAGWLNAGQGSTINLSWLVAPDSVRASLLTGMLGVQPHPVVIEVIGWLAYLIPVGVFVAWPQGRSIAPRRVAAIASAFAVAAAGVAAGLALSMPASPVSRPLISDGQLTADVVSSHGSAVTLRITGITVGLPSDMTDATQVVTVHPTGSTVVDGVPATTYAASATTPDARTSRFLTVAQITKRNGGRLPLGLNTQTQTRFPASSSETSTVSATISPATMRVLQLSSISTVLTTVHAAVGAIPLSKTPQLTTGVLSPTATATAAVAARADNAILDRRSDRRDFAIFAAVIAALALLVAAGGATAARRRTPTSVDTPADALIGHQVSLT